MDWEATNILVTGATSGIGLAVARRLAGHGARVAVCGRRIDRLDALAGEFDSDRVMAVACDVSDPAAVVAMFTTIRDNWGGLDILVNNAGLGHNAPLMSGNSTAWQEMLNVNVLGLAMCTREAITDMRSRGDDGHVVHISSMSGHRVPASVGMAFYAATKHAVKTLTEGLRLELRQASSQIRISSISPGFVETEFAEKYFESREKAADVYTRHKVLEPNDIADAVDYILSSPPHVQIHDVLMRPTDQRS